MANCYANLITIKGSKDEIQNAYKTLGEDFNLTYYDKYKVYNNDDYTVVRKNDLGYLAVKQNHQLIYYIWTKWRPFNNYMAFIDKYDPLECPMFSEWIGIENIEILSYYAEGGDPTDDAYFERWGHESFRLFGWYLKNFNFDINWHIHSYNYIFELEIKLKILIKSNFNLIKHLYHCGPNSIAFKDTDSSDYTDSEGRVIRKFSDIITLKEFAKENKDDLIGLLNTAYSREKNPPKSNHHGSGHIETLLEIEEFKKKYSL